MTRAVITGLGAVTPMGLTAPESWTSLIGGLSGVGPIQAFDASMLPVRIAAEVKDFDPARYIDARAACRMSRFSQFAVAAALEAIHDASLDLTEDDRDRAAVCLATGAGGAVDTMAQMRVLAERGPSHVSPFSVPAMIPNMAACNVSIQLGFRGPVFAPTAACAGGLYSLIEAKMLIGAGMADLVVAGGTEAALHPLTIAAMANMRVLSRRNDAPEKASRPFDRDRDGFVFGEGAVVLVVESEERARYRGARVYAELAGGALTADAHHPAAPAGDGKQAARAMTEALAAAGEAPEGVDCIVAHATGTPLNDSVETRAIRTAYGASADKLTITAPKSMAGHLLGAAGSLNAMVAVLAVARKIVPPTINLERPDPDCDLDYTPNHARSLPVRVAVANGFGFGGQNASVVFRAY